MGVSKKESNKRSRLWALSIKYYIPILLWIGGLGISGLTSYNTLFKPFELEIHVDPQLQIQYHHTGNLGLYFYVDLSNKSPQQGLLNNAALVLYKTTSEEDKYLLTLAGFKVAESRGIFSYADETWPIFFDPYQRVNKIMNFAYADDKGDFPISMGTYRYEVFIWENYNIKPELAGSAEFEITADILKDYLTRREERSTRLIPINIVGHTPLKAKKLTPNDYNQLR